GRYFRPWGPALSSGMALRPGGSALFNLTAPGFGVVRRALFTLAPVQVPGRRRFRWIVLGLATLMQIGLSLPQQTPAAIGPALTHALGLSRAELGLVTSAIWGGMLLGMLPFGMLVDRFGE